MQNVDKIAYAFNSSFCKFLHWIFKFKFYPPVDLDLNCLRTISLVAVKSGAVPCALSWWIMEYENKEYHNRFEVKF